LGYDKTCHYKESVSTGDANLNLDDQRFFSNEVSGQNGHHPGEVNVVLLPAFCSHVLSTPIDSQASRGRNTLGISLTMTFV
jgi:hypothetical protein